MQRAAMDRFANREAVRLAFEEVPVLDAVRVRRQDGAVRTGIGLYTLNRITTTAARHVNWQRHALRRGRCDGTLAACRWKTSLAVLPRQRRWTPWFSPHIGDGWSGFGRGGGHQATFIARNGSGDSWNFPTLVHMGKKRRTRKASPRRRGEQKAGAQSTGVQDGSRPHGRRVQSGKRAQARHGPASGVQDMLAWLRDCDRGCAYPGMWKLAAARTPRSWRRPI